MDRIIIENDSTNLASFDKLYSDFDQWVISVRSFHRKRLKSKADTKESQNIMDQYASLNWQLLLHGFELETKRNNVKPIFPSNDSIYLDQVIFELINNVVAWGNPANPPVLLVHGYMDSAATFIPLVEQLSDEFYYVGFDMPGHGKSDPFPPGIILSQIHIVEAMRRVVEHMRWKQFILLSHSMGCIIGLFYHQVFPRKIKKMVFLDPLPPISMYYYVHYKIPFWYNYLYNDYYGNFEKWTSGKPRLYTYENAISLVVRNRSLTEEQADIVLSRSLIPMGIDTYKLSWEPRMKKIASVLIPEETLYTLMTTNMPPTLSIDASESKDETRSKKFAENLLHKCDETLPHFHRVTVNGGHDVHITHPELLVPHIENLLKTAFEKRSISVKCKL